MPRNLDKRVEIVFPVEDPSIKAEIMHVLDTLLQDTVKAHLLQPDGTYEKVDKRGKAIISSQDIFAEEARARARHEDVIINSRVFIPAEPPEDEMGVIVRSKFFGLTGNHCRLPGEWNLLNSYNWIKNKNEDLDIAG